MHWLNMGSWPLYLGFTTSRKAFKAETKRLGIKQSFLCRNTALATTHRLRADRNGLIIIIAARSFKKTNISKEAYSGLIAHEALHAIQYLREEINQDEQLGHEAEAYLMQYIVQECLAQAWNTGREYSIRP